MHVAIRTELNVNYSFTCKLGGYVSVGHNSLRDKTAELSKSHGICKDVDTEPGPLPISGEVLPSGTTTGEEEKLIVCARNLWSPLTKAFANVRVFHPQLTVPNLSVLCIVLMRWRGKERTIPE